MKFFNQKIIAGMTAGILTFSFCFPVPACSEEKIIRVMPLGDSITDGFTGDPVGGYRLTLWKMLEENGYTENLDFVGPNWGGDGIDPNHAGYSGYAIADIPGQRSGIYNFSEWLMQEYPADVILLQIGTNDILSSALDGMEERLELLIDTLLHYVPEDGALYVSTIPYMDAKVTNYTNAYTAEEMDKAVDDYNAQIREIVSRKQAENKPIIQADINSVLTKEDLLDGVHPNATGYQKMGNYWYNLLTDYLDGNMHSSGTETTETIPETVSGDVNTDKQFNLQDVVLMQKYLLGVQTLSAEAFRNADMNQDSHVNIFDLVLLKRKAFDL